MPTIVCPNRGLQEWKDLAEEIGEGRAYLAFFRSGDQIPTVEMAKRVLAPPKIETPVVATVVFKRTNPPQVAQPLAIGGKSKLPNGQLATNYAIPGFEEYRTALLKPSGNKAQGTKKGWRVVEATTGLEIAHPYLNRLEDTLQGALNLARKKMQQTGKEKLDEAIQKNLNPIEPKSETPVAAVAKVAEQVQAVAKTEGQRPAKEVKSELVQRLEKAIEDAPSESEVLKGEEVRVQIGTDAKYKPIMGMKPLLELHKSSKTGETPKFHKEYLEALAGVPKITIDIPGDGTFTIHNTKEALTEILVRAKQLDTKSTHPAKTVSRGISKEDKAWVAEQVANQQKPTALSGPVSPEIPIEKSPLEILSAATQVKVVAPKAATSIRVTRPDGKSVVVPLQGTGSINKGDNPLRGETWKKIEAGTIAVSGTAKGQFRKLEGDAAGQVKVIDMTPPKKDPFENLGKGNKGNIETLNHENQIQNKYPPTIDSARVAEDLRASGKVLWGTKDEIAKIFADADEFGLGQQRVGTARTGQLAQTNPRGLPTGTKVSHLANFQKTRFFIPTDSATPAVRLAPPRPPAPATPGRRRKRSPGNPAAR